MQPKLTLMLVACVCLLTAGCASTKSVEVAPPPPPRLTSPDTALTAPCKRPVALPDREITQKDVETLWITDRQSLLNCRSRHVALVEFYKGRDALLAP